MPFTRKLMNDVVKSGRSSGLATVEHLPASMKQWYEIQQEKFNVVSSFENSHFTFHLSLLLYSYGDSAGFKPDFPFNPIRHADTWEPNWLQM